MKTEIKDDGCGGCYVVIEHELGEFEIQLVDGVHSADCNIYLNNTEWRSIDGKNDALRSDLIEAAEKLSR